MVTVIVKNQTAGDLPLERLGAPDSMIPANGQVTLSDFNTIFEIQLSDELTAYVDSGDALLEVNSVELNKLQSLAFLSPAEHPEGIKNNRAATADPTVGNDEADGYSVGSEWINLNSGTAFTCVDASIGAAVWSSGNGCGGIISAYDAAGGQRFTTATTTINLDTTHFDPDSDTYTLANDQVAILKTGRYFISGSVTLVNYGSSSRTEARSWLEKGTTEKDMAEIGGTRRELYLRLSNYGASSHFSIVMDLTAKDILRLRAVRAIGSGTCYTMANGSALCVMRLS